MAADEQGMAVTTTSIVGEVFDEWPEEVDVWRAWTDGKVHVLRLGFQTRKAKTVAGFASTVYEYARRHGLKVKVKPGRPRPGEFGSEFVDREQYVTIQFRGSAKDPAPPTDPAAP